MTYEIESGPLAIYVYAGEVCVSSAFALTHGGWVIYLGDAGSFAHRDEKQVPIAGGEFWSRREVIEFLQDRFPGAEVIEP